MYDTPVSLKECCLNSICDNLTGVFESYYNIIIDPGKSDASSDENQDSPNPKEDLVLDIRFRFRERDVYLFNEISESLLSKLVEKNLLCDATLRLFCAKHTRLRRVKIKPVKGITYDGLNVLRQHKIVSFECTNSKRLCMTKVLNCLSDWSRSNLTELNVSHSTFVDSSGFCLMVVLTNLTNLRCLNVSYTEFNQQILQAICDAMKFLEKLDISGTYVEDFSPLLCLKDQLISLVAADFRMTRAMAKPLTQLTSLRNLDVSIASEKLEVTGDSGVLEIISCDDSLPNLVSLDISGCRNYLTIDMLKTYVEHHPKLKYLGLVLNSLVFEPSCSLLSDNNNLMIAGVGNESQITLTLRRHCERAPYVQKALYHLFQLSGSFQGARPDIFELVLCTMAAHPIKFNVQLATTACLYNLTKGDLSKAIHPKLLSRAINLTLNAMERFPDEYQLQKNSLLTLCSDRLLQEVHFERFRCARLVLDSLCGFDESNMNRMAVAICSILAAKISTEETSLLGGKPQYMQKLLKMVQYRIDIRISDVTMKYTLSALWNLTDESDMTCSTFLEEEGAEVFLNVLQTFKNNSAIETKVLGLLNNIAEFRCLRKSLMNDTLIKELHDLLKSEHIDVSYFAAGIVAHLTSDGEKSWTAKIFSRDIMLLELETVVSQWDVPGSEMVAYRSFKPFFPLLQRDMDYRVQLWAVWAIQHVCTKNPGRYCSMMKEEGGVKHLAFLLKDPNIHPKIQTIASHIILLLK